MSDIGWLITIFCAVFGALCTIIGFVVKAVLKSNAEKLKLQFEALKPSIETLKLQLESLKTSIDAQFAAMKDSRAAALKNMEDNYTAAIEALTSNHNDCKIRTEESIKTIYARMDGIFKEWANFMAQYFKIDTTRANRLDACFKNVDEMREVVREIKPLILRRIEESATELKVDLRDYVKDRLREKEGE